MHRLCVIEGDGIGKEVIPEALKVMQAVLPDIEVIPAFAGWDYFQNHGESVPIETLNSIHKCGAGLFGAVSSPSKKVTGYRSAIITLRQALDLYSNIRPIKSLPEISPRPDVDMIIVRENSEGLYSGRERLEGDTAIAERVITKNASHRIALRAMELMRDGNRQKLTIVHKANILPVTDGLFRDSVKDVFAEHMKGLAVDELLVDTAAMKIISEPEKLDTLVTTNLFGDILSDEAAYWGGGMGLAPSLNWGDEIALAEPVHGSAPDIAGKGIANPIAAILSATMLIRYIWKLPEIADRIEKAVNGALSSRKFVENGRILQNTKTEIITRAILDQLI
jgi:homoisocitrate dehydrogenase